MGIARSQILMEATSTVPRQTKLRLSNLAATARCWRSLPEGPLDGVALLVRGGIEGGRAASRAAAPKPAGGLVGALGNRSFGQRFRQVCQIG